MEILRIHINITETNEVISENTTIRMILFDGYCTGDFLTELRGHPAHKQRKSHNTIRTLYAEWT